MSTIVYKSLVSNGRSKTRYPYDSLHHPSTPFTSELLEYQMNLYVFTRYNTTYIKP